VGRFSFSLLTLGLGVVQSEGCEIAFQRFFKNALSLTHLNCLGLPSHQLPLLTTAACKQLETLELNGQDERCFTDAGHDAEGNTTIALTDLMTHFPRLSRLGLVFFYFSSTFFSSLVDTTVAGYPAMSTPLLAFFCSDD